MLAKLDCLINVRIVNTRQFFVTGSGADGVNTSLICLEALLFGLKALVLVVLEKAFYLSTFFFVWFFAERVIR